MFVFFQLRRGESLGVSQRLFALVIRRRQVLIGARDFDVVSEHVVEPHLERPDSGALPLAGLDLRDVPLAILLQVAQLVELRVKAGADGPTIGHVERRLIGDRIEQQLGHIRQLVQPVVEGAQARALPRPDHPPQRGNLFD